MAIAVSEPVVGPRWQFSPELAAVWPVDDGWPLPRWLAAGSACVVKKGPQRTVFRVDLPELSFYLKQHHLPNRLTWVRQCLRGPKGRREFDRLRKLADRGVAAPTALGWGTAAGWLGVGESYVVTRALDDVVPLHRVMAENHLSPGERMTLACELGRFLARLHDAGVDHRDLHSGNIVVRQSPTIELFLVDLDAVRVGSSLSRSRSLANLTQFGSGCILVAQRADRLRFLRSYAVERGWIASPRGGSRELFDVARDIERQAWGYCLTLWSHRDERCLRTNRYYQTVREGRFEGMAVSGLDGDWLKRLTDDPDAMLRGPGVRILKHSKTSTVAEIMAMVDGRPRPAILKKIGATKASDPWAALIRATPILRSWVSGQGFLERHLPTPRPLVMLHRIKNGLKHDGYLVTEKLEHVQELDAYVAALQTLSADDRSERLRTMIERVARAVRDMHRRHISHRDLKAANMLVTSLAAEGTSAGKAIPIHVTPFPVATTNLWFIDLVGVSRHTRLGKRRRVQNVARLNASFLRSATITRTDRLRFLRIYLSWGIHGKNDWKSWWRSVAAATNAKVKRNEKAGRVVG